MINAHSLYSARAMDFAVPAIWNNLCKCTHVTQKLNMV